VIEYILAVYIILIYLIDTLQTIAIHNMEGHKEGGLIARYVPKRFVPLYFTGVVAVLLTICYFIPSPFQIPAMSVISLVETIIIVRNYIKGVRVFGNL